METRTVHLYTLGYSELKTYLIAFAFAAGNVLLPQLFHLIPQGGITWLPIYFFTLIGAYKYGWKAGLLIAILSPLVNSILFGMPPVAVLPAILTKSVLLALCAGVAAKHVGRVTIPILIAVVLAYQILGTAAEWLLTSSLHLALQDFRIAIPGMLLQVFGGYVVIKYIIRK